MLHQQLLVDLLDIRIFSAMNSLIKDKIKGQKDEIKTLDLSKDNIKDKVEMQTNFIEELEKIGKGRIEENKKKMRSIGDEVCVLINQNEHDNDKVYGLNEEQKNLTGASEKLKKLNTLKGKITQKVSTITKEHKFFTDNTVCHLEMLI